MPQKQISVTIDIPEWANWVAQDYDSEIWFTLNDPVKYDEYWNVAKDDHHTRVLFSKFYGKAPNWQNSKIDLRENDFEIVNGELVAIPKTKDLPEMLKVQA